MFDVFSPPPPPPPVFLSLSLPLHFNFYIDSRTVCLSQYERFLVLMLLLCFLSLNVDLSLSPSKKNKNKKRSGMLLRLLSHSLSRDVHMRRKNNERHIYTSNLKFFPNRFSQPGHLRGYCRISQSVSLPLLPGIG